MEMKSTRRLNKPLEGIKGLNVAPVYLLYGPENYLIEEEIQSLLNQVLTEKERGLNLHLFSGEEDNSNEIVQAAQTIPMFSRYRFVLVKEADRLDEERIEPLLKYIQKPSPTTILVFQAQTLGPWKGHRADIEGVGRVMEYPRLKGRALIGWLRKRMAEKGKALSEEAGDYLVEVVGDHLQNLENALEEAFLGAGEKRTVGLSDVEGIVSDVKVSTIFDLTDAIGRQDLERALLILDKVLGSKIVPFRKEEEPSKIDDPVPLLLSMMARQYRLIWRVSEMHCLQCRMDEITKRLKKGRWEVEKLIDQGKRFTQSSLREGLLKCHRTDLAIKRGQGPKGLLMEKLVIDLCRPR